MAGGNIAETIRAHQHQLPAIILVDTMLKLVSLRAAVDAVAQRLEVLTELHVHALIKHIQRALP